MGESDFVLEVLAEANEKYNRYYKLKSLGYDLKSIEQEVGEIYEIGPQDIYSKGRQKIRVEARSLFLGRSRARIWIDGFGSMPRYESAGAVSRGERIAKENNYQVLD